MSEWLGVTIEAPDGPVRASPLDADAFDVPTAMVLRTDLHGFAPAEISLPRPEGAEGRYAQDRASRWKLAPVRVWDAAGRTVWEGRVVKISVGATSIDLDCEGPAKSLEDDETARALGIDADLNSWGPMSRARRIALIQGNASPGDPQVSNDTANGLPALFLEHVGNWAAAGFPNAEANYEYEGLLISEIKGSIQWQVVGSWEGFVGGADDASHTNRTQTSDLVTSTSGSANFTYTPTTAKAVGLLRFLFPTAGGAQTGFDGVHFATAFRQLKVIGDHGLTLRGTFPDQGYYASDLAEYVVGRWGPLVSVNTRSIEPTSFVIPHWVHKEDTTAAAMLDSLALFGGNDFLPLDWWVYDDWTFGMASPDNHGRVWRIRLDEAAELSDAGDDATTRVNGVKVAWTDGAGTQHTVGPPGSGSETETTDLEDTRPDNPVNLAKGASRKIRSVDMGITYEDGAILMGQTVMADANRQKWSGDIQLKGSVREQGAGGAEEPVYMVRSADRGVVEDDASDPASERRITSTSYDVRTRTLTATIGTPPELFPALAARAGVVLEGR